jgi:hypothetical protein
MFKIAARLLLVAATLLAANASEAAYNQVFMGYGHACVITTAGALRCWGENDYGQLGDGTTVASATPVDVKGLPGPVVNVALGLAYTCAALADGSAYCWGLNSVGQLGNGEGRIWTLTPPGPVKALAGRVVSLTAGDSHACALLGDGSVQCWGEDASGQFGEGVSFGFTPVTVRNVSGATSIGAGATGTCAVSAGRLSCWPGGATTLCAGGDSVAPFIPVPPPFGSSCAAAIDPAPRVVRDGVLFVAGACVVDQIGAICPASIADISGVAQLASGSNHACALMATGAVKCWGDNSAGQLGDGTVAAHKSPRDVPLLASGVVSLAADGGRTCAVTREGELKCWGDAVHLTPTDFPWPQAGANYQGMWWASPGGSESGWGLDIAHQGDKLFMTWFTFDLDGSPMWLSMPDGAKVREGVYSGALYRTTGPDLHSPTFDPSRVANVEVGSATLAFSDASNGLFTYTVYGITQSKPVTRFVFASPLPRCGAEMPTASLVGMNFTGLWWRATEAGWGLGIAQEGNVLVAIWFAYDESGKGQWLILSRGIGINQSTAAGAPIRTFYGDVHRATKGPPFNAEPWDSSKVVFAPAGYANIMFEGNANGRISYTVDGRTGSKALTRTVFADPASICR